MHNSLLTNNDHVLFTHQQQLICSVNSSWSLMNVALLAPLFKQLLLDNTPLHVGAYEGAQCYVVDVVDGLAGTEVSIGERQLIGLRALMTVISDKEKQLISRALQLLTWKQQHQYCGQCGVGTQYHQQEQALHCNACALFYYPRISPCMMCLITKGDYCLLAQHEKHRGGFYSTLAGFVEAGETIEQTVHREVMEEVGLQVGQLNYFSSQSWPFPHQLMVGYFAEYQAGEIAIDDDEIVDAQWFHYSDLPEVPPPETLSGMMINTFVKTRGLIA
jgi:NAD+ diphosphatase